MNFYGDYHIHTDWSDGKSTIREIEAAARNFGLKEIAFTEHGIRNPAYSVKKLIKQFDYINEIKAESETSILFGNEADLIGENGEIDISIENQRYLDLLIVGFHQFAFPKSPKDWFRSYLPAIMNPFFSKRDSYRKRNTQTMIKCIEKNSVDILSHPNHRFFFEPLDVAKACVDTGTLIELNIKHLDVIEEILDELLKTDVKMIVSSDSHELSTVGRFEEAEKLIERYGISSRIVNLGDKKPQFKNHK